MVWIETPTNPTMQLVDIEAVCKVVKAKSEALIVVDNTFMSAYFQVFIACKINISIIAAYHVVSKLKNSIILKLTLTPVHRFFCYGAILHEWHDIVHILVQISLERQHLKEIPSQSIDTQSLDT